ncbi:MAG: hypothetical protein WB699_02545 [Bacteroidota bacterium]
MHAANARHYAPQQLDVWAPDKLHRGTIFTNYVMTRTLFSQVSGNQEDRYF